MYMTIVPSFEEVKTVLSRESTHEAICCGKSYTFHLNFETWMKWESFDSEEMTWSLISVKF